MDTYKVMGEFNITGRGLVIAVNLAENGFFGFTNKDLKQFMNKDILYKDVPYKIVGIEVQGCPDREVDKVGFLLRQGGPMY